jgi:hypothetical protein
MPAHSRPKDGVAALAYVEGIHAFLLEANKAWMAGTSPAMTNFGSVHVGALAVQPAAIVLLSATLRRYIEARLRRHRHSRGVLP